MSLKGLFSSYQTGASLFRDSECILRIVNAKDSFGTPIPCLQSFHWYLLNILIFLHASYTGINPAI